MLKLSDFLHAIVHICAAEEGQTKKYMLSKNGRAFFFLWDMPDKTMLCFECPICGKNGIQITFKEDEVVDCQSQPINPYLMSVCKKCLGSPRLQRWIKNHASELSN